MQWLTKSRLAALASLAAGGLMACADGSTPSSASTSLDTAYAALVASVADCAKQVKACTDAASDDAAVAACRTDFASCRDGAGKSSVDALANAARSCTATHKNCARAAERGEAASCQDELRTCLRAAHADDRDDDDAGADDNEAAKARRADCLDALHPCVEADGPANVCAEEVRQCVVDSVPDASDVVPEASDDDADTGNGRGKAPDADAGARGKGSQGKMSEARMCVDTLRTCIDAGMDARSCASSLKACRSAARAPAP